MIPNEVFHLKWDIKKYFRFGPLFKLFHVWLKRLCGHIRWHIPKTNMRFKTVNSTKQYLAGNHDFISWSQKAPRLFAWSFLANGTSMYVNLAGFQRLVFSAVSNWSAYRYHCLKDAWNLAPESLTSLLSRNGTRKNTRFLGLPPGIIHAWKGSGSTPPGTYLTRKTNNN